MSVSGPLVDWILFIFAGNKDNHKISDGFKFNKIRHQIEKLAALEGLEKFR